MKLNVKQLNEGQVQVIENWMAEIEPRVLPSEWKLEQEYANVRIYKRLRGVLVLVEVEIQREAGSVIENVTVDTIWLHVSVSHKNRMPTYEELSEIKLIFIGNERKAIQVFPAAAEHYNRHPNCLHLFAPLERDPLPDFRDAEGKL